MKKSLTNVISIIFLAFLLSACSMFADVEEIKKEADIAFENKEFEKFNELYLKLKDVDKEESEVYIEKIKMHEFMKGNYQKNLEVIKKEIPELRDFVETIIKEEEYYRTVKQIDFRIKKDIEMINLPTSKVNSTLVLVNTLEEMNSIIESLEKLVFNANESITILEDLGTLEKFQEEQGNLINSLRKYEEKLENKYLYLKENEAKIISTNELLNEGNIFALSNSNDITRDIKKMDAEIQVVTNNLEQRLGTISSKNRDK
jgi:hypothetical protein